MFPIKDDNPRFLTPVVTLGLIGVNVAAWVFVQGLGTDPQLVKSVCELGLVPGELLQRVPAGTLVPMGQDIGCVTEPSQAWHTVVTSMFLHGGWLHLLGNLWFLWIFGKNVEDSMGHVRFAVFYPICGLVASALQVASQPDSPIPIVGASGAIGGIMGAYIVLYPRVRVHMLLVLGFYVTRIVVPAVFMLGYWFLLQLAQGAVSIGREGGGVAFWAHVGGFAAGAVLIFVFRNPALVARHPHHGWSRG